jgi:hypothetical protein
MNLKEIINRPNETPLEEDEACLVIKQYIKARKGVDVKPKIEIRYGRARAMHEVNLMHQMLNHAIGWFRQNPYRI